MSQSGNGTGYIRAGEGDRDLRLDACRGLALWFTFIDHIPDNPLSWLTMRNYGLSDAGEVFVFVSGYTCMIAYGGGLQAQGWSATAVRAARRAWEIYAAFLLLLVLYFALVWLAGGGGRYLDETNTGPFFNGPGAALARAVVLQYTPVDVDILPTFVWLHLTFPLVLWLMVERAGLALALSVTLYLLVQMFDWHVPAWPGGELYFNPLAWQVLFVLGAWCAYQAEGRLRSIIASRVVLTIALLYLVIGVAVALSWHVKPLEILIPEPVAKLIYPIDKSHLSPLRLFHFLALAVVVARLWPRDWPAFVSPPVQALIRCGEHALPLYCLSVLLSFLGQVILKESSAGFAMHTAISVGGIAVMIAVAHVLTWAAKRDQFSPGLF